MERIVESDVLVIGGGSGGCVAAIKVKDAARRSQGNAGL